MTNLKTIGGTAAFIALMGSTAAFADVTAKEVWTDWHDYMSGFGYEIAASESATSDGITVDGLTVSMALPEDEGTIKIAFGTISFKEQGDGTVAVVLPDRLPMAISVNNDVSFTLNYDTAGMSMIVSGSANEMAYNYSAPQVALSIADLVVEGEKIDDAKFNMVLTNMVGKSTSAMGSLRTMVQSFSTDMLTYDFALTEPGGEGFSMKMRGSIADFNGTSDISIPKDVDFEQFADALTAGFSARGGFIWGAGSSELMSSDRGETVEASTASKSGGLSFAVDRDIINYGGSASGTKMSMTTSEFPIPVDIAIGETLFNLLMPVNKTDTPSDFGLTIKLGDFSISDGIWGLFDPKAVLSRDPATIHMDFTGKANWLVDIMNPESDEVMNAEVPGQLHALTLKTLQVKAAGAELTGAGGFTFNNDDLETFDGLPAPTGAIDLMLTGGNGLMDNLVAMGLLPEDEAMGARMMMGLFAIVGEGEDTLTSKIEVTADGQVLANGQRLK